MRVLISTATASAHCGDSDGVESTPSGREDGRDGASAVVASSDAGGEDDADVEGPGF